MVKQKTVLREFDRSWGGKYSVERMWHGRDWRSESSWDTKAAAYYAAEILSVTTGDTTRVVLSNVV